MYYQDSVPLDPLRERLGSKGAPITHPLLLGHLNQMGHQLTGLSRNLLKGRQSRLNREICTTLGAPIAVFIVELVPNFRKSFGGTPIMTPNCVGEGEVRQVANQTRRTSDWLTFVPLNILRYFF